MRVKIRELANKYLLSILCLEAFRLPGSIKDRLSGPRCVQEEHKAQCGQVFIIATYFSPAR